MFCINYFHFSKTKEILSGLSPDQDLFHSRFYQNRSVAFFVVNAYQSSTTRNATISTL